MKGVQLTKLAQELNLTNLTPDIDLTEIYVKTAEINRPALQLTGYLEHFANERVQIIGYVEYTYLMQLSDEERTFKYERFISSKIPCVIFSTMTRPSQDMIDLAYKYNVPTFVTERTTSSLMAEIIRWLGVQLAPCISIHGVLVDVYGEGVLITGESGIGKSEAALELIKRVHRPPSRGRCPSPPAPHAGTPGPPASSRRRSFPGGRQRYRTSSAGSRGSGARTR